MSFAAQQILDTLCPDKPPHHTHQGSDSCVRTAFATFCLLASGFRSRPRRAPAFAQQPYDGLWQVTVVTKTGSCEPTRELDRDGYRRQDFRGGRRRVRQRRPRGACARSRSMVHMRTVNSAATPDRGSGMAHQQAYRAAVGGKHPASKINRTSELFAHARRPAFAAAAFFVATFAGFASHAQSGPFAGMAGSWSGGGTVTLDDGSTERIRCRATYAGRRGANMEHDPDLRQRRLQVRSRRPMSSTRAAPSRAPGARAAATSAAPCRAAAAAAISRWSPARPASMPTSRCGPRGNKQSVTMRADSQFRGAEYLAVAIALSAVTASSRTGSRLLVVRPSLRLGQLCGGFLDRLCDQQRLFLVEAQNPARLCGWSATAP